ncbi:hypothetical protein KP509_16G044100 [Ceratopteris richardii]|uniref:Uncharacterized protein n=1 Tax=Ceratopteris richardii TaxID=49495 RepID=A0A8T2SZV0_CERRI|nr:hypothetical protein KP509_16G044100 [Ceratopteris richardii]
MLLSCSKLLGSGKRTSSGFCSLVPIHLAFENTMSDSKQSSQTTFPAPFRNCKVRYLFLGYTMVANNLSRPELDS